MKTCSVCGSPEHPDWKAHTFVRPLAQEKKKEIAVSTLKKATVSTRKDRHRPGYQRDLMRVRRALKSGRAESWPRSQVG